MKFENLIKNFVKIEDKLAFNIFITIFMFVCSFVSYSEEPLHDICCDYIEVNTEIIDDCCVIINIYNPYCANFETVFLVKQYDSYSAVLITQTNEWAVTIV